LRFKRPFILDVFANPYALQDFPAAEYANGLVLSYQNSTAAQELSAQLIFGAFEAKGRLPVGISRQIPLGTGMEIPSLERLEYGIPQDVQMPERILKEIDQIVEEGVKEKAYPGAQVLIAVKGNVIYHKAFGKPTYEEKDSVDKMDLYDVASVTKIASSLLALMDLESRGKVDLDTRLGKVLKYTRKTPYEDLTLREILAHQAGLVAWIPFYLKTLHHGLPHFDIYSKTYSEKFPYRVAENLYMNEAYRDSIYSRILQQTRVSDKKEYKYSDIGYYFIKDLIEEEVKRPIDVYNQEEFYHPLGMNRTTFKPLEKFDRSSIIPTEVDKQFRRQLVHGDVHDPGAAMLGGVGGHAGLFTNANDLAKLMQMYMQKGNYGGKQYLDEKVLEEYTACQFCAEKMLQDKEENRRGAGFDKPAYPGSPGPTCDCVSFKSFGHSGFTGTYAWADPEHEVVYIFLSNRVYPTAENKKLVSMNIRTRIQEKIYEGLANPTFADSTAMEKNL
jgi:CubicO group peptidase (beta-lactamase class C family)